MPVTKRNWHISINGTGEVIIVRSTKVGASLIVAISEHLGHSRWDFVQDPITKIIEL